MMPIDIYSNIYVVENIRIGTDCSLEEVTIYIYKTLFKE